MNGSGRQIFKDLYAGEANKRSELLCTRADKFNPSEIPSSKQTFQPAQPSSDGMQGTLYNHIMSTIKSTRSPEIEKNNKGRAGKKIGGDQTVEESPTSLSSRTALLGCGVLFCCMHEEWLRAPSSFHFLPSVFALVLPFAISTHPSGLFLTFTSLWKEKEDRERGGERKKKIRRPLDLHVCPPSHQSAPSLSLSLSLSHGWTVVPPRGSSLLIFWRCTSCWMQMTTPTASMYKPTILSSQLEQANENTPRNT
mmetsp:Transcript_29172/g.57197  ORF Transcript_29172/g.57197 Transcript_29172/m.57197 type:complete len:252 (-) Transcript_29172:572-1327(-)